MWTKIPGLNCGKNFGHRHACSFYNGGAAENAWIGNNFACNLDDAYHTDPCQFVSSKRFSIFSIRSAKRS